MGYIRDKFSLVPSDVPYGAAKELVRELDEHLASHAILLHQYLKPTWLVSDAALKSSLEVQSDDTLAHLKALAEDIVRIGGVPTCGPCAQENLSYLTSEHEGLYSRAAMLIRDVNAEETLVFRLNITAQTAAELEVPHTRAVLEGAREAAERRGRRLRDVSA